MSQKMIVAVGGLGLLVVGYQGLQKYQELEQAAFERKAEQYGYDSEGMYDDHAYTQASLEWAEWQENQDTEEFCQKLIEDRRSLVKIFMMVDQDTHRILSYRMMNECRRNVAQGSYRALTDDKYRQHQ